MSAPRRPEPHIPLPPHLRPKPNGIERLHRWKDGELADDLHLRPWNSFELEWYTRIRAENLARREELVARGVAMNGPPTVVMPQRMETS